MIVFTIKYGMVVVSEGFSSSWRFVQHAAYDCDNPFYLTTKR